MKIYSPEIIGDTSLTGALDVTGGITGSLFGTASYADFALSASYAPDTTFPYTGDAQITGSLSVLGTGSISGSLFLNSLNTGINIGTIGQTVNTVGGNASAPGLSLGYANVGAFNRTWIIGRNNTQTFQANGGNNYIFGHGNTLAGNQTQFNVILGVEHNLSTDGDFNIIAGGHSHQTTGDPDYSAILGGLNNTIGHDFSAVIGGQNISTAAAYTVYTPNLNVSGSIVGSSTINVGPNTLTGTSAGIIAGTGNNNSSLRSVILGGENNTINGGQGGVVAGGINNTVTADYGFIGGGSQNSIVSTANRSAVIGGFSNQIQTGHTSSVIIGGENLKTTKSGEVVVPDLTVSGSANISGSTTISGSVNISGSTTVEGNLTISGSGNLLTFADGTTQSTAAVGGTTFPYTGSAIISGSLEVTGSFRGSVQSLIVSSNTASIDCNTGNFFTLLIPGSSTTEIVATNITPGQTINVLFQQEDNDTGSVTFPSYFKFAGGFDYTPTLQSGSQDIVSMVAFNSTDLYTVSVKNLL